MCHLCLHWRRPRDSTSSHALTKSKHTNQCIWKCHSCQCTGSSTSCIIPSRAQRHLGSRRDLCCWLCMRYIYKYVLICDMYEIILAYCLLPVLLFPPVPRRSCARACCLTVSTSDWCLARHRTRRCSDSKRQLAICVLTKSKHVNQSIWRRKVMQTFWDTTIVFVEVCFIYIYIHTYIYIYIYILYFVFIEGFHEVPPKQ